MPSWSEWVGEEIDPGGGGSITIRFGLPEYRAGLPTLIYGLVAAVALGVGVYFALTAQQIVPAQWVGLAIAGYLLIGYMFRPEPDRHNLGWFGGAMDNPFRWSDDVNRWLMFIMLALWPARFISESLIAMIAWPLRSSSVDASDDDDLGPELMDRQ